jgi:surface antigen
MKKLISGVVAGSMLVVLTGCTATGQPNGITNEQGGTVIGAVAGGLVGSTIGGGTGTVIAVIGGTLLGGFIGNRVGHYMDQQSQIAANQAAQNAMDSGSAQNWHSSTAHGRVVPHKAYHKNGHMCRPFTTSVTMNDGKMHTIHGTACKNSKGQWVVKG